MYRRLAASLLVLLAVSGCVSSGGNEPSRAPRIVIAPDEREGYWRATYELEAPVSELRFERTPFRTGVFEVLTEGFALERQGDADVLVTAGIPARRIEVRFPEYTRELEKEYELVQKFTDGSVAIYTGHLAVRAGSGNAECTDCAIRRFRFVPPPGQHVIAGGRVTRGAAEWVDTNGDGAYVYIGSIAPIETAQLVAVVDPGLPGWLWEETRTALPRLFDLYTSRLGASPLQRPLVLFNYMDSGGSGYSSGGGVLPGQIQLRVDGAAWQQRSDDAFLHLFHFLAHEAAHLWNGSLVRYEGSDDAWMHEGSADALAARMLHALGYEDQEAYARRQTESLNECRRKLARFPLRDAARRNAFDLYYNCGNMLALFTEKPAGSGDLFEFWKELIARVRDSGRTVFDTDDYYATMTAGGASPEEVTALRRFVEESATADDLAAMLRARGVRLAESAPSSAWGYSLARDGLLRLMGEHCKGPYGFTNVASGLSLTKTNVCDPLPAGGIVTSIGGHDVRRDGAAAWDALHVRCGPGKAVSVDVIVDGATKTIDVPCTKPVPARPAYLAIEAFE